MQLIVYGTLLSRSGADRGGRTRVLNEPACSDYQTKKAKKDVQGMIQVAKEKLVRRRESATGIHQVQEFSKDGLRSTPKGLLRKQSKNIMPGD